MHTINIISHLFILAAPARPTSHRLTRCVPYLNIMQMRRVGAMFALSVLVNHVWRQCKHSHTTTRGHHNLSRISSSTGDFPLFWNLCGIKHVYYSANKGLPFLALVFAPCRMQFVLYIFGVEKGGEGVIFVAAVENPWKQLLLAEYPVLLFFPEELILCSNLNLTKESATVYSKNANQDQTITKENKIKKW